MHVIIARESSEAGNYFNDTTFKFMRQFLNISLTKTNSNIFKQFKDFFERMIPQYIKFKKEEFG